MIKSLLKIRILTALSLTLLTFAGSTSLRAQDSELMLEEIVVTVTKRAESVQDIASSVSALSSDTLRDYQVQTMYDVANFIPNVVVKTPGKISIRGVSASGFQGSNAPQPVAQHENGLFIAETGLEYPLYDIGSVEVVRGPSGTVFGRNATSGAIDVRWAEPTNEFEGGIEYRLRSGEYANSVRQVQGYVNLPIVEDRLQLRLAFVDHEAEAHFDNLAVPDSEDPGEGPRRWMRAYLQSQITDDLRLRLRYIDRQSEDKSVNSPPAEVRASGILERHGATPLPVNDLNQVRSDLFNGSSALVSDTDVFREGGDGGVKRFDGDLTWNVDSVPVLGDIELFLLAGQVDSFNNNISESDGSDVPILDTVNGFDRKQTSFEFRVSSTDEAAAFKWLFGYFRSDFDMDVDVVLEANLTNPLLPNFVIVLNGINPQSTRNKAEAFYFSGELDLEQALSNGPPITLFAGIRENKDETRFMGVQSIEGVGIRPEFTDPSVFIPLPLGELGAGPFDGETDFSQTTGEAGLRWHFQDDAMAYLKFAKGYKAGKLQQLPTGATGLVEPEELDAIELGLKSMLLDSRLQLNAAAFFYDYKNLQVTQLRDSQPLVTNATDADIWGLELDLQYLISADLSLSASLGYLSTEFKDYCSQNPFAPVTVIQANCTLENPQDLSGNELPDAPELTAALVLQHEMDLGNNGRLLSSFRSSYRGESFRRPQNDAIDEVSSYIISDLRLLWSSPSDTFQVELFVENLGDEDQIWLTAVDLSAPGQMALLNHLPGRRYGAAVKLNF